MLRTPLLVAEEPSPETSQLDTADLLKRDLPVTFRGYDRKSVDELRAEVSVRLSRLERALAERRASEAELTAEVGRLGREVRAARASQPRPLTGEHTVSVLAQAQATAEQALRDARAQAGRITAQAQHDTEQMKLHAQAQAGQIVREANERGRAERLRIIETATEEARSEVDRFQVLARSMQKGMQAMLADHQDRQADWDAEINQPIPPVPAQPAGA